ncbi:MAG: hypothetical protein ABI830_12995 [Pseudolabrys sp.]
MNLRCYDRTQISSALFLRLTVDPSNAAYRLLDGKLGKCNAKRLKNKAKAGLDVLPGGYPNA